MRALLVEDDANMARSLELTLVAGGWAVELAEYGEDGLELGRTYDYDVILLDLGLPDMGGIEVLKGLRRRKIDAPVVILSAADALETKVKALSAGADDYLTKPVHRDELVARLHAVVRRSRGHAQSVIAIGDIAVNLAARSVEVAGAPIHLTGKEYDIVELMALRKGEAVSKETFLNHLYGGDNAPEVKIIDVFMCKLRKKFAAVEADERCIRTIWGHGYMLQDPARASAA